MEGRLVIDEAGHEIYYKLYGSGPETLVCLHGGPGADHRYLVRMGELSGEVLKVLLYDQLGSGQSDRPDDDSLWTVPRFVGELETIRSEMNLGRVHLYGQSWGGMLALQYALDHPEGVKSLILSNTAASMPEWAKVMAKLKMQLPTEIFATVMEFEATQQYEHPDMIEAMWEFYARYVRRSFPFEPARSLKECKEILAVYDGDLGPAYTKMWGPFEFLPIGTLLHWDVTDRLGEIKVPTLIVCGLYDEAAPELHRAMADRVPNNEFVIFGNSSHLIILEKEADAYLGLIKNFIDRVIASSG
ncbi:MAG: proline iminopeptidase-family hydrolase [Candidatus Bathyarchaeota archaeon]|nr:proline iminopeptidase-family hydrolase [Candidatus Bathyarchaeota archaeon]